MKEIKFYNIEPTVVGSTPTFLVNESVDGDFAFSDDVIALQARIKQLEKMNIVNFRNGQHEILDRLFHLTSDINDAEKIKLLICNLLNSTDSLKEEATIINEIKAQYLEWIIETIQDKCKTIDPMGLYEPAIDVKTLKGELKKLRDNTHDN